MTRYYMKMAATLLEAHLHAAVPVRYLPVGFDVVRVIRIVDGIAEVEVEDTDADSWLAGKTVKPWFQMKIDGSCVITRREVMEHEHNQVRMEQPKLETGEDSV